MREGTYTGAAAALFSFAMGLSAVAIPLLALESGYSAGEIGTYIALSALAQFSIRSVMSRLMRRVADKHFVVLAGLVMALSCGLPILSVAGWAMALAQIAQGIARGLFWTGTQTHAVRTCDSSVRAMARLNLSSGVGKILGPLGSGPLIALQSEQAALGYGAVLGAAVAVPALFMRTLPPLRSEHPSSRGHAVWRRPEVVVANWAAASAGAWQAAMNSYIPVVLEQAHQSSSAVGLIVAVANAASIAAGVAAGLIREHYLRSSLLCGVVATGLGMALFGLLAGHVALAGAAVSLSALGSGVLITVGPAVATEAVSQDERGEAIASSGSFRAAALFVTPLGMAALVTFLAVPTAVTLTGIAMSAPVLIRNRNGAVVRE